MSPEEKKPDSPATRDPDGPTRGSPPVPTPSGNKKGDPETYHFDPSRGASPSGSHDALSEGVRVDMSELEDIKSKNDPTMIPQPGQNLSEAMEEETFLGVSGGPDSMAEPNLSDPDDIDFSGTARDRYRLIRVLGKGGFGVVYLAHDRVLEQDVAIKILKLNLAGDGYRKRFIFEARTAAKLRHSSIVNVFDIRQTKSGLQLVMEYYPGGTLDQLIRKEKKIDPKRALELLRQVAVGLSYAHDKNIIHRDIKPGNIFFGDDETVKLGDFGICAHYEHHDNTMTGEVIGTPYYMAPEQARDSTDVDPRSDIYALGLTLYHMVSGKPPRVVNLQLVPQPLRRFIAKTTAEDRSERPASCRQLIALIDRTIREWEEFQNPSTGGDGVTAESPPITGMEESAGDLGPTATANSGVETMTGVAPRVAVRVGADDSAPAQDKRGRSPLLVALGLVGVALIGGLIVMTRGGPDGEEPVVATSGGIAPVISAPPQPADPPDAIPSPPEEAPQERPPIAPAPLNPAVDKEPATPTEEPSGEAPDENSAVPAPEEPPQATIGPEPAAPPVTITPWDPNQNEDARGAISFDNILSNGDGQEVQKTIGELLELMDDWKLAHSKTERRILWKSVRMKSDTALESFPEEAFLIYAKARVLEADGREAPARKQYGNLAETNPEFLGALDEHIAEALEEIETSDAVLEFLFQPPDPALLPE